MCGSSLAASGDLRTPEDLLRFWLLRTATPQPPSIDGVLAPELGWEAWLIAAGVHREGARSAAMGPLFGSTQLALEAAAAGRGVALGPAILVEEDLRSGQLVQPFDTSIADPFSYWMLYRKDRAEEARIRAFAAWTLGQAMSAAASA